MSTLHIGIIGHLDITNPLRLREPIKKWFRQIYSKDKPEKVVIHTACARGADRIAARVALNLGQGRPNAQPNAPRPQILPVLPFSLEVCKAQGYGRIDAFLRKSGTAEPKILNTQVSPESLDALDEDERGTQLNDLYAGLAPYFRDHCDIVLALYDGVWLGAIGGTSYTIEKLRSPEFRTHPKRKCTAIHCLSVARTLNPFPANEALTWRRYDLVSLARKSPVWAWLDKERAAVNWPRVLVTFLTVSAIGFALLAILLRDDVRLEEALLLAIGSLINWSSAARESSDEGQTFIICSRYFALALSIFGTGAILNRLFESWDRFKQWWVATWKKHDLIFGVGYKGGLLFADTAKGDPIIAVDKAPSVFAKAIAKRDNRALLVADATDPAIYRALGMRKASRAFVCTGDDNTDMRVVLELANALPKGRKDRLVCVVSLHSKASFETLENALPENHQIDLRMMNTEASTARAFLRENHIDRFLSNPNAEGARVIILGDGPMADELTRQVIQQGIFEQSKQLEIVRLCTDPSAAADLWASTYPCFGKKADDPATLCPLPCWKKEGVLPDIRFLLLPPSHRGLVEWVESLTDLKLWVTSVIVAIPQVAPIAAEDPPLDQATCNAIGATATLAPALQRRRKEKCDVVLWTYYNSPDDEQRRNIERTLNKDHPELPIRLFSAFLDQRTRAELAAEDADRIARRINGHYCGIPFSDRAKLDEEWMKCSENDKDSNRQAAAHAHVKVRIRSRLRAAGLTDEDMTKELARAEHRRWCAEYLMKGYRPLTHIPSEVGGPFQQTQEEKTAILHWFDKENSQKKVYKANRRHIDLVPYDDLPTLLNKVIPDDPERGTKEQNKDLSQIKKLDAILGIAPNRQ